MHNLEKHPTIKGAYIAYDAAGYAFRIHNANPGWAAFPSHAGKASDTRRFRADRLKDCAAKVGASFMEK
jgi:hypothetical protein